MRGKQNDLFPIVDVKVSVGPYGLIELAGENRTFFVNSNGLFDARGHKVTCGSVKKGLGID